MLFIGFLIAIVAIIAFNSIKGDGSGARALQEMREHRKRHEEMFGDD